MNKNIIYLFKLFIYNLYIYKLNLNLFNKLNLNFC